MKLPLSWLKDFVAVDASPEELSDKLLGIGFEVEEIIYTGKNINNVKVGKIIDIKKHFSADKLRICTVDMGSEITTIVTAATNVEVGDKVPVALDNSDLPSGKHIEKSELRGVMSYGMFCSGGELMIDDTVIEGAEVNGILILPEATEIGADIKDVLGLNDYVLDVSIPANRADCQSVYGLAREIAALYGKKAKRPSLTYKTYETQITDLPHAEVTDKKVCTLYTGKLVTDIKIEKSPKWMRDRLRMVGIRPINNVVDITNYVLMEVGQPLHAFDLSFIDEKIVVRHAENGEKIVALDGKEYELTDKMLVIADKSKALAIAGVMGGEYSGINENTKTVFLEAARFAKESVRGTSRTLGLRSDSSARYEKGVDYGSVELGRERALALFNKLKAGKVTALKTEDGIPAPGTKVIRTSASKINELFGIDIKQSTMISILKSLEFGVETSGGDMICSVPIFREDIDNYTDLAEEIIRFYGYDSLTSDLLKSSHVSAGGVSVRQKNIDDIKNKLNAFGAYECCTYSFINPNQFDKLCYPDDAPQRNAIKLINPLSEEFSIMRTELVGSMLNVVYTNRSRKNGDSRLYEIAKTYLPHSLPLTELPDEHDSLCIAYYGKSESFYTIKAAVVEIIGNYVSDYKLARSMKQYLHPGVSADIIVDGKIIGSFGKIHPTVADNYNIGEDVFVAEIDMSSFIGVQQPVVQFKPLPKFPSVDRDLAVTVDKDMPVGELVDCIKSACGELCESVELFDVYSGEQIESGKKSVAFNIILRSSTGTLTDACIQETMNAAITSLDKSFGAKLR